MIIPARAKTIINKIICFNPDRRVFVLLKKHDRQDMPAVRRLSYLVAIGVYLGRMAVRQVPDLFSLRDNNVPPIGLKE